jgi:CheY-like chemotaxis protein
VLVVEDNLDSVRTLAYLLSDMGHTVEYAINGYVALDIARRFRPQFVLLDLGLPGLDGFEVCTQIKHDPDLKSCRVVAFTASSQQEYRDRAKARGCELYWVKPVHTKLIEDLLG